MAPTTVRPTHRQRGPRHTTRPSTRQLVISGKAVSNHISAIFAKLQVADRAEAITRAREAGMGTNT